MNNTDIETLSDVFDDDDSSLYSSDTDFFVASNHSSSSTENPSPFATILTYKTGEHEDVNVELHILKLHDPSIINMIEKQLCKVNGIENVEIDFATGNALIKYNKILLGVRDIVEKVESLGFKCKLINDAKSNRLEYFTKQKDISKWKFSFLYSLSFTIPILIISIILPKFEWGKKIIDVELVHGLFVSDLISFLLSIPVQFGIGKKFYVRSFKELRSGNFTTDLLIMIATSMTFMFSCASMIYSIFKKDSSHLLMMFDTSTMLITFVTLSRYMENIVKRKSLESITKLLSIIPETTTIVYINSTTGQVTGNKIIPTEYLQVGDIVKVAPGAIVPADGKVISGLSDVYESTVTGRKIDEVVKKVRRGDDIIGGSINGLGSFEMQITHVGNDTILSQMIKFVEDAQTIKAPIQLLADRFTAYFIPVIIFIGIITLILWKRLGISILVIACPCALALSGWTAVMVGMGIGAQNGMLIKGGRTFEVGSKITKVVFNKTGILTQGNFDVAHYELNLSEITPEIFFTIIGAAESSSEHPIGKAIVNYSKQFLELREDEYDVDISDFEPMIGCGIKCDVLLNTASHFSFYATSKAYNVLIGNIKFVSEVYQVKIPQSALIIKEQQELLGRTTIVVAINDTYMGLLFLSDKIKPETNSTINALKSMGIDVAMITADQQLTAQAIASQCGINEVYSQLSPVGKLNVIQSLQLSSNEIVAMVGNNGDANDSLALSKADVGISLVTDNNMEFSAADIILMNGKLTDVISSLDLSRNLFNRIKYNFIYISLYNLLSISITIGLLLIFGIYLHPILAGILMSLASLSAVFSNLLLLKSWEKPFWIKNFNDNNVKLENNKKRSLIDWFRSKSLTIDSRAENIIEL